MILDGCGAGSVQVDGPLLSCQLSFLGRDASEGKRQGKYIWQQIGRQAGRQLLGNDAADDDEISCAMQ